MLELAISRWTLAAVALRRRIVRRATLGKVEDTVPDATAVIPGNAGDDALRARTRSSNFGRPLLGAGERIMGLAVKVVF